MFTTLKYGFCGFEINNSMYKCNIFKNSAPLSLNLSIVYPLNFVILNIPLVKISYLTILGLTFDLYAYPTGKLVFQPRKYGGLENDSHSLSLPPPQPPFLVLLFCCVRLLKCRNSAPKGLMFSKR